MCDVLNGHNGTTKLMLYIAGGLQALGHNVTLIYFGRTKDWKNVDDLLKDKNFMVVERSLMDLIAFPLRIYAIKKFWYFTAEDIVNLLREFSLFRILRKLQLKPDFIIFSNVQSAFPIILSKSQLRTALFVHEAPDFREFGFPIESLLKFYVKFLLRNTTFTISINYGTKSRMSEIYGSELIVLPPIAFNDREISDKVDRNIILMDTRWTTDRDPYFIIKIVEEIGGINFIMHGSFPNDWLRESLVNELDSRGLSSRCSIISGLGWEGLENLYMSAKIMLRWSGMSETGNSVAVMDAISHECVPVVDNQLGHMATFISENISPSLVVERDQSAFIDVIKRLVQDDEYYSGIRARIRASKKTFTWEKYSAGLLKMTMPKKEE